jgi:hypothetical protein
MKVYSISKWAFRAICLLIVILPVSRQWRLLSTGDKARGTVTEQVVRKKEILGKETEAGFASEIQFEVDGKIYQAYGPPNYEYTPGRSIMVFYDPELPSQNCIATFGGFYLNNYIVLPIILLVLWAAFYMSFNNYSRKQRFKKGQWKRNARGKAQPFRRIR